MGPLLLESLKSWTPLTSATAVCIALLGYFTVSHNENKPGEVKDSHSMKRYPAKKSSVPESTGLHG